MFTQRSSERGAALVEAALVMPLLILLLVGIVEFGRVWNVQLSLTHAAREGIREYVVSGNQAASEGLITAAVTNPVGTITFSGTCDPDDPLSVGTAITVIAPSSIDIWIPFWGARTFSLTGKATMRCGG